MSEREREEVREGNSPLNRAGKEGRGDMNGPITMKELME